MSHVASQREQRIDQLRAIAAAAVLAQVFTLYVLALAAVAPPTEAHWARVDPILAIAPRDVSRWLVPALAVIAAAAWWRLAQPRGRELRRAATHAALGLVAAGAVLGLLRAVSGPTLPSFVPAEESAGPGYLLSMTAGFGEEVLFRFALLPALYLALARRLTRPAAIATASVLVGLAFALLHEAGPGAFDAGYFATRVVIPGAAMSAAFLAISPAFVVTAHGAAHILIPALFV